MLAENLSWVWRLEDEWEQTVQTIQVAWDKAPCFRALLIDKEKNPTQTSSKNKKGCGEVMVYIAEKSWVFRKV